jgi:hypothetical protein
VLLADEALAGVELPLRDTEDLVIELDEVVGVTLLS